MRDILIRSLVLATSLLLLGGCRRASPERRGAPDCVVRVGETCIERRALRPAYRLATLRHLEGFTGPKMARWVAQGIVERELLVAEAERLGLTVDDHDVAEAIAAGRLYLSVPMLLPPMPDELGIVDGRVTVGQELSSGDGGSSPPPSEEAIRKLLGIGKSEELFAWQKREALAATMREHVKAEATVTDDAAFQRFVAERTTAKVDYVFVRREWVETYAMPADAKDADAWAEANPGKVLVPTRHIMIRLSMTPTDAEVAEAQKKAEALLKRLDAGESFAALAREASDDATTKDRGGEMRDEMDLNLLPDLKAAIEKLRPGERDPKPIRTGYGFHLVARDAATHEVNVRSFKHDSSDKVARAVATDVVAQAKAGKQLSAAADEAIAKYGKYPPNGAKPRAAWTDELRPRMVTSPTFKSGDEPILAVYMETNAAIVRFAMSAEPKQVAPSPFDTLVGSLAVQLQERRAPTRDEFEKERATYVADLLDMKRHIELRTHVFKLQEAAKEKISIAEDRLMGPPGDAGPSH